ncbi:MAG TPA: alpha-amylase family protein [Thermoanaerobaculia bacterium]|nr:alpha-amylase family protein [Thermoanaerobaculia bacterium]
MIDDLWFKTAIIYSLDLETFQDGNGDGIGDFDGLIRRLDYLDALGVDAIWLAPFQPSPNRDNGYDISDYYGVDPRHGSSGNFVEFMHQARNRGLKVLIDLVVNHTSDQHRWFQEARKGPSSSFYDWYVWSKKRPPDWNEGMVFPGVQDRTWTRDKQAGAYYFHRFHDFQPDLNLDNPAVRSEIMRIIGYWLELGVEGFRVDAVPFLIEKPSIAGGKAEMQFEVLEELRAFLQWRSGKAIFLGEANVLPKETRPYFADGRGIHMMFNFWVNQHLFYALASGDAGPLTQALRETKNIPETAQWVHFLRNHDELDLGRLTKKQRETVFSKFGPEKRMQLYDRGIRRRLSPMLGDRAHVELAYSMLFALPGTPVLRYGDEIAMGDDLSLKERDAVRTPMQWSEDENAGFSTASKLIHPVISRGVYDYRDVNVERQKRERGSLLRWTARMIRMRKECPEISLGEWRVLPIRSPHVLGLQYEWRGAKVVTIHSFDREPREIRLRINGEGGDRLLDLRGTEHNDAGEDGVHRIRLDAYGYRWFRVGTALPAMRGE